MSRRLPGFVHRVPRLALALLTPLLLIACEKNVYELNLSVDGDKMQRELLCYRQKIREATPLHGVSGEAATLPPVKGDLVAFPEEELARITAIYGADSLRTEGKRHSFKGTFTKGTPEDVGGAGYYTTFANSLGQVAWYSERFRGDSDIAGRIEKGFAAVNRLSELLIGWLSTEVGEEDWWPDLRQFIAEDLRDDVKNLLLYAWLMKSGDVEWKDPAQRTKEIGAFMARVAQFLAEHDYIQADEVPTLYRLANAGVTDLSSGKASALALAQTVLKRKMGASKGSAALLGLVPLFSSEQLESSLEAYLKTTEEWRQVYAKWESSPSRDPEATGPEAGALVSYLAMDIAPFILPLIHIDGTLKLGGIFQMRIRLNMPSPPTHSNGTWDAAAKQVVWSGTSHQHGSPASFAYATWVVPDVTAQRKFFGRVLLDGEALTQYSVWHAGLSTGEAKEWNQFLAGLGPDGDLVKRIKAKLTLGGEKELMKLPTKIFSAALED